MNINKDLAINSNNLLGVRSVKLSNQDSPLEGTETGAIYESDGNLFYNDGDGTTIQITADGALAASSLGGISGLPWGTAGVGFSNPTYTFKNSSTTYARLDSGPVKIRSENDTNPTKGITIASPDGLANNYTFKLPTAVPDSTSFLTMATNGTLQNNISTTQGITNAMRAPLGQASAGPNSVYSVEAEEYADVTGLSFSLATTGRPVLVSLQSLTTNSGNGAQIAGVGGPNGARVHLRFKIQGLLTTTVTAPISFYIFRNEISPLFYDRYLNISSTKFEGGQSLEPNKVFKLNFNYGAILTPVAEFQTFENPYYIPEL